MKLEKKFKTNKRLVYITLKSFCKKTALKIVSLLFCLQPLASVSQSNTIWVKSLYSPLTEFLVFVESSHSISYSDYLLTERRARAKKFKLKERLLKAQELYLLAENKKAVQAFKSLSDLAYQADWNEEDRRIITYSLLRRAQLAEEPEKRKALLLKAGRFFIFKINKESYSDYDLFPPPLIEELQQIQAKRNELSLDWNNIFPDHEIILLNGRRLDKKNLYSLPQAVYKITALSSSHQTWSKNISLLELAGQKIKTASLTEGPCQKLELSESVKAKNIRPAPVSNCPKLNPFSLKTKEINLMAFDPKNLEEEKTKKSQQKKFKNWPAWAVAGAGIIALSLVLSLGGKKDKKQDDYIY